MFSILTFIIGVLSWGWYDQNVQSAKKRIFNIFTTNGEISMLNTKVNAIIQYQ